MARYILGMGPRENIQISFSKRISYVNHDMVGEDTCLTHNNLKGCPVEILLCREIMGFFSKIPKSMSSLPDLIRGYFVTRFCVALGYLSLAIATE